MDSLLDAVAGPVDGVAGTTDTALLIRFPDGQVIPVGIQTGRTARQYIAAYTHEDGYTAVGVKHRGRVEDLPQESSELG